MSNAPGDVTMRDHGSSGPLFSVYNLLYTGNAKVLSLPVTCRQDVTYHCESANDQSFLRRVPFSALRYACRT